MPIPPMAFEPISDATISPTGRIDGNTSRREQQVLATLVHLCKPKRVLELGTFNGLSTHTMALNAPASARILTVDIPAAHMESLRLPIVERRKSYDDVRYIRKPEIGAAYKGTPEADRVKQLLCDTALLERRLKGERYDFIFVDASHSYEYTRNDSALALKHLADGGIILWHDYGKSCWPGVKKALDELHAQGLPLRRIPKTSFVILDRR